MIGKTQRDEMACVHICVSYSTGVMQGPNIRTQQLAVFQIQWCTKFKNW